VTGARLVDAVVGMSFLENAFVRWVLTPAVMPGIVTWIAAQYPVSTADSTYYLDFLVAGSTLRLAVELDGIAFHSGKAAFVHDRIRQNELTALGYTTLRFSYDAIRDETSRCVAQLQGVLRTDPALAPYVIPDPIVPVPDNMTPSPLMLATPPTPRAPAAPVDYFDLARPNIDLGPLRSCQYEAMVALANYYRRGGRTAACVMSVGAGKTALGVVAALAFTRRRALIVTPGRVIRGTFATALDPGFAGNVLYTLRGGPVLPGCKPPTMRVLDSDDGPIRAIDSEELRSADIIVTNFHTLGTGGADDLLGNSTPRTSTSSS
jgi:hypothetical protein